MDECAEAFVLFSVGCSDVKRMDECAEVICFIQHRWISLFSKAGIFPFPELWVVDLVQALWTFEYCLVSLIDRK